MVLVLISDSLEHLDYLEGVRDWSASVNDQIQTLKMELKFIQVFYKCREVKRVWDEDEIGQFWDEDVIDEFKKIEAAIKDVGEVILLLHVEAANGDLDLSLFPILEKIELIKPVIDRCYDSLQRCYISEDISGDQMIELIDCVLENLKDLLQSEMNLTSIVGMNKSIDTLERKLLFQRYSLEVTDKLGIFNSNLSGLFGEAGDAVSIAARFSFSCWINKMDELKEPGLSPALKFKLDREWTTLFHAIVRDSSSISGYYTKSLEAPLVRFIDFLLQRLKELLSRDGSLEYGIKDQSERLHEELNPLISLIMVPSQYDDNEKSYLKYVAAQVNNVAWGIEALYVGLTNGQMITRLLLVRLKLINSFYLVERLNDEASLTVPIKDQSEMLCENLRLLGTLFTETHDDRKIKHMQSHIEAVVVEVRDTLYDFYVNKIEEDMSEKISCLLHDLLEKIKFIKADMRKICLHSTASNLPETRAQNGITAFLEELCKLLTRRADSVSNLKLPTLEKSQTLQIQYVQNKLEVLISFLVNFEEQSIEIGVLKALEIRIMNMANKVECITDPMFIRVNPGWYGALKFIDIIEEFFLIKKEIEVINEKIDDGQIPSENILGELVVGFGDAAQEIIEKLIQGPDKLNIISVIGMGGLGKTTLAKKLYNNPLVVGYFDVQAWCCISYAFQKRQVLLDILGQVVEITGRINQNTTDDELEKMLFQSLKGRRYLIVMDDIWDIEAWTALRRCFCDDGNGSRIVFTTRLKEIALKVKTRGSISHLLRYFNDNESFELLRKKLFPGGKCPREEVGNVKQIAKYCKGLPLAVVVIAGVLASKKREEWKEVAESLSQHIDGDLHNLTMEVFELSYNNLPDDLRPCFLYLGGFPEDKEIPVKKLTWLWVAEGFAMKNEHRSSEDIAEDFLMDLIGRSLVTVAEIGSSGGVKTCRIHDLLLEFSLNRAKKEKFTLLLNGKDEPSAPVPIDDFQHEHIESYNSNPLTHGQYRMCIYSMLKDFDEWPSSFNVCSLVHFAPNVQLDLISSYVSFIIRSFKFLNVLDLGRLLLKDLNCGIELLVQLRLLSVRIQSNSIPASISNLSKLETLIVKGIRGEVAIPSTIWSMICLRHLHVDTRASLVWEKLNVGDSVLDKLETLSTPSLSYVTNSNSRNLISSSPNLRKLKCIFTELWSYTESCNKFPDLEPLIRLESLKVVYYGKKVANGRFSFPSNLKKLTLSKFQLPWSDIATIGTLPNLEVLKLLFRAFDGKVWETRDDEFPKLKYLKLEALDIEQWNVASEDHFPRLKKVVVHRCKQLEEIPSSVGNINTLLKIEVKWCNTSAANSAKEIYDEQHEMGNESFEVNIHPYPSNEGAASSS